MTRRRRIALISTGAVLLLLAIAAGTGVVMVRSGWLREKIRERVVAEAEKATGGRVEIGALRLDWKTLTAELDNLTIHGTEPADAAPLLSVKRVAIGFKILSFIERRFNVARVEADGPAAHVIIEPDGSTNLPHPKIPQSRTGPEIILALKIGKFDLANGMVAVDRAGGKKDAMPIYLTPWNARGENLTAQVQYNRDGPRYEGTISVAPVDFGWSFAGATGGVHVTAQVTAAASMEKNRLTVSTATVKSAQSEIDLSNVLVSGFNAPLTTGQYKARVSLAEADKIFKLVNFQHTGFINAAGTLHFVSATDYLVTGGVRGAGIGYGNVRDIQISGNLSATPDKVAVNTLLVNALGGEMRANGEVRKFEDFHLAGQLEHFDARSLAALAGGNKPPYDPLPYDGILSGPFDATGKMQESNLHRIVGTATLEVLPAGRSLPVHGELSAKYDLAAGTVELGRSWLELPHTRLDLSGALGQRLDVRLQSRDLNDLSPVMNSASLPAKLAGQNGSVAFNGTVSGPLAEPRIAGHATILSATYNGQQIDSLAGDFTAMKTQATVTNAALVSNNLRARITGSIGLTDWKPVAASAVNANVQLTNADMGKLLALAGQTRVPVSGTLNTTAQVTGTIGDPHATADLTLSRGQIYGEPYDSVTGHAQYLNSGTQLVTAAVDAGKKRLNASLRFDHPDKVTFSVTSNAMALDQIALVRKNEPNPEGTAQIKADGVIRIDGRQVNVLDLNADIRATGLALDKRALGDAHFTAETKNGIMAAKFDSNVAKSTIHGDGTVRLEGDYPVNAKVTFSNLGLSGVAAAMRVPAGNMTDLNLDGSAAGEITLTGPAKTPDQLTASIDVTQFELHPLTVTGDARGVSSTRPNVQLKNDGPIRATLAKSVIRVESAHFQGPDTDLALSGTVALNSQSPFDLSIQGNMNLALAQTYNAALTSSGELTVSAAVRGSYTNPDVSGRAELRKGDFHYADFANGLTNANGVILFNGRRATIQSLSAESGGGKVDATGFAALTRGLPTFRIEAKTRGVRVRYPEGVSSTSDADITLAGTSQRSEASGTVTVRRIAINPKSDISGILEAVARPMKTAAAGSGFLENVNLDVQIETAPDVAFQTSVAQSLEADANLRLRGTAASPAVLGRINITQGELDFFGNKYAINQGSISFFNPAKIDPILNIDLSTKARGVDVTLIVTGPINKLNVSYRSDPPLQFSDIVALLATGRSPTDPTLAVRNTGESQNLQQLGASALIGQAISNPTSGRLERFFGVSNIKIDPQSTGITGSQEARLTVEQQVSPELLFTYINDVSSTSTQLIRVEWDFNRRWAAIVTREENGYVGLDFAFKKRFK
jgi:translocation and assembly module TamB